MTDARRLVDKLWSSCNVLRDDGDELKRLIVDLIDMEHWSRAGTGIKGDAYEQLLSRGAEDLTAALAEFEAVATATALEAPSTTGRRVRP